MVNRARAASARQEVEGASRLHASYTARRVSGNERPRACHRDRGVTAAVRSVTKPLPRSPERVTIIARKVAWCAVAVQDERGTGDCGGGRLLVLRVFWRGLALLAVAIVYLILAVEVVWSAQPVFESRALSRAESSAIREARSRDESICGLSISNNRRGSGSAARTISGPATPTWSRSVSTTTATSTTRGSPRLSLTRRSASGSGGRRRSARSDSSSRLASPLLDLRPPGRGSALARRS